MVQRTSKFKKVYACLFLSLMIILAFSSIGIFYKNKFYGKELDEIRINSLSKSYFVEIYPFDDNDSTSGKTNNDSLIISYSNKINTITKAINSYLTSVNPFYSKFNSIKNTIVGFNDDDIYYFGSTAIVKLSNGYYAECFDYCPSQEAYDNILDFSSWLSDIDIPYITLITPYKSDDSIAVFPEFIPHGYSETFNDYVNFLESNNLYYIDAKQILLSENDDLYYWFYKTDHHWNANAAFVSARETANILYSDFSLSTNIEILNKENFNLTIYENSFIGSYGKKVGGDVAKEDMEIFYPTFATDFHIEIPNLSFNKTGTFEDILIDQTQLSDINSSYSAFLYSDKPLIQIENDNCDNGTRILVIKLSFANPYCAYLANTVQYLDMIDPRSFDGSIRTYIKQTNPDAVILCMGVATEYEKDYYIFK